MARYLLVDAGQGGCRFVHIVDGRRVESSTATGLSRHAPDRAAGLPLALERAFANVGARPDAVDAVVMGTTGFDGSLGAAREIADGVRSLVGAERVVLTNDAVTSYLGAVGFEPGAATTSAGAGSPAPCGRTTAAAAQRPSCGVRAPRTGRPKR